MTIILFYYWFLRERFTWI